MTDNNHPITPPPELVRQWWDGTHGAFYEFEAVATQAARWGADQELEECCEWLSTATYGDTLGVYSTKDVAVDLRAARRPNPPSLKEQAMQAMDRVDVIWATDEFGKETLDDINVIRRALESLPD